MRLTAICAALALAFGSAAAQNSAVLVEQRLSDWLLANSTARPQGDLYLPGLQWQVQEEKPTQESLKFQLLGWLNNPQDRHHPNASPSLSKQDRQGLTQWLQGLPITGRVAVGVPDARWLQGQPAQDPILLPGQQVVLPLRPRHVTIILPNGQLCHQPHTSGADARSYVQACGVDADWAWIAQPDGRTQRLGIARWNEYPQDEPAPGAWLWAPGPEFSEAFNETLIRLVATQGPSMHAGTSHQATNLNSVSDKLQPVQIKHSLDITASNWGTIGLIQTPSARMMGEGGVLMNYSAYSPYGSLNIMLQPMPWLEFGFRYTDINNRAYGEAISNQTYKDKSLDIKVRLIEETRSTPQLALGFKDIGGTGLFSGEYLVGSKRHGNLDFSLGMGWGYLGGRSDINNPIGVLANSYYQRPAVDTGQGGVVSGGGMFKGPAALFGGVQWRTDHGLLKVELDGNNYQQEPLGSTLYQRSPINLAWVKRVNSNVDFQVGFERGNQVSFGLTLHGNLQDLSTPKVGDPEAPKFSPSFSPSSASSASPQSTLVWNQTARDVALLTGWQVQAISQEGSALHLSAVSTRAMHTQERIQRAVAVLHRDAPANIQRFVLLLGERGLAVDGQEVDRAAWVAQRAQALAPSLKKPAASTFTPSRNAADNAKLETLWQNTATPFKFGVQPSYSQILGGPDSFVLYQLGMQAEAQYHFAPNSWADAALNLRALDNYGVFRYTAPSDLPRVRTYAREFATTSRFTLPILQLTTVGQLSDTQFVSAYGGMLETMYAGVGTEWLWRPNRSRVALGLDVNHVQQRAFEQDLNLRDYSVNTGHLTLYWDTGIQNLFAKISAGQYLAGDRGVTVDVSRRFDNGVTVGVYATKTNVSAEQFGEGSFDKGLYVQIPFDVMLPRSSNATASFNWNPLTRDGGAKLNRLHPLFDLTSGRDRRATIYGPPKSSQPKTGDDIFSLPASASGSLTMGDLGSDVSRSATGLGRGLFDASTAPQWLGAAGLVLLASSLDNSADTWAKNNQGEGATQLAKTLDNLPLLLGAGAGALALGLADDDLARTGYTAVKAAGFTLLGNVALKTAVGRARPLDEQGSGSFNGFSNTAPQSSFASNHVATTMALVTPFAQQYQQPWLYSLGALSALGRVQQREHWLSDTAAAGVLGYAVGSVMLDQQRQGPQLSLVGNRVQATWRY